MKKIALFILIALSMCFAEAQTSRVAQEKTPDINHAYIVVNRSGYALDIADGEKKAGTNVRLWERNDSEAQQFRLVKAPDGYFYLLNERSGKMMDVSGGKNNRGDNMQIWYANSGRAQKFELIYAGSGYYYIKAYDCDYYVSPQYSNPSRGTNVILWDQSGVAKWQFVRK